MNTSKKQAYESRVPLQGDVNPRLRREKSHRPVLWNTFRRMIVNKKKRPLSNRGVESVRTKRPGPKAPPLEMFYLPEKSWMSIHAWTIVMFQLRKPSRHVARGFYHTPPLESFDDVKGIAAYLGVHLGAEQSCGTHQKR